MRPKFRVIFMGRKMGALKALEFLTQKGVIIRCIVCPSNGKDGIALHAFAKKNKIPFLSDDAKLYSWIAKKDKQVLNIDLVISYLYPKKIRTPLIELGSKGCINYHPAPLPENKGRAGYNTAILEGKKRFGVSVHFIHSEEFDVGPIIRVLRFPIKKDETVLSLEATSQEYLLTLFKATIPLFVRKLKIKTKPNIGGLYLTGKELEAMKRVLPNDSLDTIKKKIRAFTFPPHHGATIEIQGETFTILDRAMLDVLARHLH